MRGRDEGLPSWPSPHLARRLPASSRPLPQAGEGGAVRHDPPARLARKAHRGRQRHVLTPAAAVRIHRPAAGARQSLRVHRGREIAQRGAGPCAVRGSARPRQDDACADHVARTRRQFPRDVGAGHRQGRRSRGAADQSRRARRSVHRRDPPAQPGGRGNPLSGDGGFPARPHHRRGTGGALGAHRSREVHADRRDDALGPSDDAAARPFRHSGAARISTPWKNST